jgi:hypothetical protein
MMDLQDSKAFMSSSNEQVMQLDLRPFYHSLQDILGASKMDITYVVVVFTASKPNPKKKNIVMSVIIWCALLNAMK